MTPPHGGFSTIYLSVIPVQGDIQRSHRDLQTLEMFDVLGDSFCQRRPTGEYAHQREVVERRGVTFEDLMRDAPQGTVHPIFREDLREGSIFRVTVPTGVGAYSSQTCYLLRASLDTVKGLVLVSYFKLTEG
jgi:hypothetical protein